MIPLHFSTEHKEKLREMIRFLFPEFDVYKISNANLIRFFDDKDYYVISLYEFVFGYLVRRIQRKMPQELVFRDQPEYVSNIFSWKKGDKWTLYSEFHFKYPKDNNRKHPVDFLYEEFLQLKNYQNDKVT